MYNTIVMARTTLLPTKRLPKKPNAFVVYAVLTLGNLLLNLVLPANAATMQAYHLSTTAYHVLILLIYLPLAAIWFTAFYSYKTMQDYTALIKKTEEGQSFYKVSRGLEWLAWGAPLSSILAVVLYAIVHNNTGFYNTAIVIEHYVSLLIAVVAFTYIGIGTHQLAARQPRPSSYSIQLIMLLFTAFGVLYSFFTFNQVTSSHLNPYGLPLWVILLTIIIPYLYAWYMGLFSAYEILLYRRKATGLLYKRALTYIASGISTIIASSIMVEFVTSGTKYLTRLNLNAILFIVYVFLVISAVGYLLVALGTKRLKRIEEV